jgi:hypothetical protein
MNALPHPQQNSNRPQPIPIDQPIPINQPTDPAVNVFLFILRLLGRDED